MIKLTQLSDLFENSLNAILGDPEIQFKIWSHAGQFVRGHREGNTVTYYINGNLRTSTSANDATDLVMGVNGLSLEFAIPIQNPRTNATQSEEDLQKIKDGQYPFVQKIFGVIDSYFQKAKSIDLKDDRGVNFSVSFQAGTSISGTVDILPVLGPCITVSVYIEVYFIEGGISSKDVKVTFDGMDIPFQAVRHGRSPMLERDVYAGSLISKSIVTSTALSIDVEFPANGDKATEASVKYYLSGEPNVAHFIEAKFDNTSELYLMTLNNVQISASGIAIAGVSASFMEIADKSGILNVPDGFQVGSFNIVSSVQSNTISFTPSVDCLAYIAGKAMKLTGGEEVTVEFTDSDIEYDETNETAPTYELYIITDRGVNITAPGEQFTIVKEAVNGGE